MGAEKYLPLMEYIEKRLMEPEKFNEEKIVRTICSLSDSERDLLRMKLLSPKSTDRTGAEMIKRIRKEIR